MGVSVSKEMPRNSRQISEVIITFQVSTQPIINLLTSSPGPLAFLDTPNSVSNDAKMSIGIFRNGWQTRKTGKVDIRPE
jgi:hypothetical protein